MNSSEVRAGRFLRFVLLPADRASVNGDFFQRDVLICSKSSTAAVDTTVPVDRRIGRTSWPVAGFDRRNGYRAARPRLIIIQRLSPAAARYGCYLSVDGWQVGWSCTTITSSRTTTRIVSSRICIVITVVHGQINNHRSTFIGHGRLSDVGEIDQKFIHHRLVH
ncbi:hypothetical protein T03_13078 [Trichinella britovi]|uniref:Uncharacterized protein n=1 Tax=Trichinella britovi TaxID=45882 RepID=A0A0V1CN12_TRIBR|nr:hypothetical protein T03_13078 [Trichinella britovi]